MTTLLVTGSSGLVGSECVRHFDTLGWDVHGLDNNQRRDFFGRDGDTSPALERLQADCSRFRHHAVDIRDRYVVGLLVAGVRPDLVIHAAAQPSHDWAANRPFVDFDVNAGGTLSLLEAVREFVPTAAFVFLSTNKVYGDAVNRIAVTELPTRYEWTWAENRAFDSHGDAYELPDDGICAERGVSEAFPIDASTHSLFGCSKLAADLYVQEYGRYFGMKTATFRCGCLTGGAHAAAEAHGFLAYLAKCCREGRPYTVYGHKGKQVRDQLHGHDVARACEEFFKAPRAGEVYNLGGGRPNGVSVLEAILLVERATGKRLRWEYVLEPRKGDHIFWLSDTSKFTSHYPGWRVTRDLESIVGEVARDPRPGVITVNMPSVADHSAKKAEVQV